MRDRSPVDVGNGPGGGGPGRSEENEIAAQFHGGFYTPMEFAGDATRID